MSNMEKMFEMAVRTKLRFPFKGQISVEELWDLSVENLDLVYKTLSRELKSTSEESLLEKKNKETEIVEIKIEIIKHIVSTKMEEKAVRLAEREKKEEKQKLLEILSQKQDESLKNLSVEELQKRINDLE